MFFKKIFDFNFIIFAWYTLINFYKYYKIKNINFLLII